MPRRGSLFLTFHIKKPSALLFLNANKGRMKINECKELKINVILQPPKPL
jgi:hypothetical protein